MRYLYNNSIYILIVCCLSFNTLNATNLQDSLNARLVNLYAQLLAFPQEKAYLQTDRPCYISGEKIFFRVFLQQANNRRLATISRYVYVELISPVDSVVSRKMIRIDEQKMYYGHMLLPESLPEGNYRLRCYTRFMENLGEDAFYTRSVYIADPNASKAGFTPTLRLNKKNQLELQLRAKEQSPLALPRDITCQFTGEKPRTFTKSDYLQEKPVLLTQRSVKPVMLLTSRDGRNSFRKYLTFTPENENTPTLEFFPEGGNLIAGCKNKIAFKTLLPGAKGIDIRGEVYNAAGVRVTSFQTLHEGMGSFLLTPLPGEKYSVRWEYQQLSYESTLPAVTPHALALTASWETDSLAISVNHTTLPVQGPYYLFIHRQGTPIYLQAWDFTKNRLKRPADKFITGVTHILLLDSHFAVVSERMVFNNLHDDTNLEISSPAAPLKTRERVTLTMQIAEAFTDTVMPSCAVSVYDDKDIHPDTTTNIISEFLLSSELKGTIYNPVWYFGSGREQTEAADLLMLTHGWRQYYIPDALQGKIKKPLIKPETSQTSTGILKRPTGKPYPNAKIKMSALGYSYSDVVLSDDKGAYEFPGFEFPDSTTYFLLSYTNEKTENIEIYPDKALFPGIIPYKNKNDNTEPAERPESEIQQTAFIAKADQKYRTENGMRMVDLPEISVRARKKEPKKLEHLDNHVGPGIRPDRTVSMDNISTLPPTTLEELLWRIPGVNSVSVNSPNISVALRGGSAIFVVNGVPTDKIETAINVREIAQVDVYLEPNVILLYTSQSGVSAVIALTTWPPGSKQDDEDLLNKKVIEPLGYQKPVAFYSPQYDTSEMQNSPKPDLRSTIYWKPDLMFDKNGNAKFTFYTADTPTTYSVIIEGLGPMKKMIYRYRKSYLKVSK